MAAPTKRAFTKWENTDGIDFLQLSDPTGKILSWVDSTGTVQGNLAVILSSTVTLTSPQILALLTTPITLVPAPGVGKAIVLLEAIFEYLPVSIVYSFSTAQIAIGTAAQITGNANPVTVSPTGLMDQAVKSFLQSPAAYVAQPISYSENQAFVIKVLTSALTAGNGQLQVTVHYSVVSV